ncbi:MAG: hypothetical protein V1870_05770 [Candidatus Aenigmatarchaeota archaeon]
MGEITTYKSRRPIGTFPNDTRVTVYTGTFDPCHIGHIKVGKQVLAYGNTDFLFFYPHNNSLKKKPAPIDKRVSI